MKSGYLHRQPVANIACGFDIMGFAIDEPGDEVVIRTSGKTRSENYKNLRR